MSRMRWAGYVALMEDRRGVYRFLVGKPEGKTPLGRLRCRRKILLRWIFRKGNVEAWIGSIWLRIGTCGGHL